MQRVPALIVGGGPAGSAAAIGLARAGIRATILERQAGPQDVVCGGFLGWDALAALRSLGVDAAALGARPISRIRLVSADDQAEAALPRAAAGLSRRTLDAVLLTAAEAAGARVRRGEAVRSADLGRRCVRIDGGEELEGDALLLATGKHELRGAARPRDTSADPIGLRTSLTPSPELERSLSGVIELHLFDGGYAGLLLQEDGKANLCLSAARPRLKAAGGIEKLIAELAHELPMLAERLRDGQPGEWSAVSGVPYGWRAATTTSGIYRVGDQAVVIASLAGDGIAIALTSGKAAAEAIADEQEAEDYQRAFSRQARRPIEAAEALRWAAEHPAPRRIAMGVLKRAPRLTGLAALLTRIGR
ncbi:MAG TPA: FAD-dependent monooxygenase [Allosphingosinicella sp.]|jgi:flavin-dependent dehydrogenase|nr:FAD-dependent monooxygenase [Allosphingosinicella sp.]